MEIRQPLLHLFIFIHLENLIPNPGRMLWTALQMSKTSSKANYVDQPVNSIQHERNFGLQ